MGHRLDPQHERVALSADELRSFAELEGSFGAEPSARPWRRWPAALARRASRRMPWLVLVGLIVTVVAVPVSLVLATFCACLTAVGLAAWIDRVVTRRWAARR